MLVDVALPAKKIAHPPCRVCQSVVEWVPQAWQVSFYPPPLPPQSKRVHYNLLLIDSNPIAAAAAAVDDVDSEEEIDM